ncbi:hypothetical protein B4Q04_20305 [Zobellia sp. OII3]|nr:hypothetical protein B4Q04_20305 [Zobellia sp. OII3]
MTTNWHQKIVEFIRFLFIVLFVYAATNKILVYDQFKAQLERSPFIFAYADTIAWGVPILEYSIVGMLLLRGYLLKAFYGCLFLMTIFTSYIFLVLNFSDSVPCGCGGVLATLGWKEHLVFNLFFVGLALLGIYKTRERKRIDYKRNTT